jgi:hypothetical protein
LGKTLPPAFLKDLYILSEDADFAGPWHGLATYGEVKEGVHYAAVETCTREVALNLLNRARVAYKTLAQLPQFQCF